MNFRGQFDCTMDDKGRIKMPASLRKQFPAEHGARFMIARDIEDCLVIYPLPTWDKQEKLLQQLNPLNPRHRQFTGIMMMGLTEVEMDNADRFLVSKSLVKYLGNSKDVVLVGRFDRVQLWDAARYEQYMAGGVANVESLAKEAADYIDGQKGGKD